ncbi:MAG: glycosyltransferase family 2 protein [Lachnoclostridium sp.]|nr:glycosyltransferase family 2 protein [Lachnoclostridium sp.]
MNLEQIKSKLAIVILAYSDYESLELALATHAKFSTQAGIKIYILQNGRGTYDCERTYSVAKRYHNLFPDIIYVIDTITPGIPFNSLRTLFNSEKFLDYDYIIKLDDDVLVLTPDWIDKLCQCYIDGKRKYGDKFAYATSLVNNNPYGFKTIIEKSVELSNEYFSKKARKHYVGNGTNFDPYAPNRLIPKDQIYAGSNGTIWGYPYIARWMHEKTTLCPEWYIEFSEKFERELVNSKERYSINCMLFEKKLWTNDISTVEPDSTDDEHLLHAYCLKYNAKVMADLSIPMVHLFFFSQREECRDMIDALRECYTKFLNLEFPITVCNNRIIELENRLRFLEQHNFSKIGNVAMIPYKKSFFTLVKNGIKCISDHGVVYTWGYFWRRVCHRLFH